MATKTTKKPADRTEHTYTETTETKETIHKEPSGAMVPKTYALIQRCVEDGLKGGWNKAHKYAEAPTEEQILEHQQHYIMLELDEWFHFPDLDNYGDGD